LDVGFDRAVCNFGIQERQRFVRELHGTNRLFLGLPHMIEKSFDIDFIKLLRVPFPVKENKTPCPIDITLPWFRPTELPIGTLPHPIEQLQLRHATPPAYSPIRCKSTLHDSEDARKFHLNFR